MPTYHNVSIGEGSSLLHNSDEGLSNFHLPTTRIYYRHGNDVAGTGTSNRSIPNYTSPTLSEIIRGRDEQLAKKLVKGDADPNQTDVHGPVLSQAIRARFPELAELLLEKGANPNAEDDEGPALMQAMRARLPKVAELLLEKGANPNAKDDHGAQYPERLKSGADSRGSRVDSYAHTRRPLDGDIEQNAHAAIASGTPEETVPGFEDDWEFIEKASRILQSAPERSELPSYQECTEGTGNSAVNHNTSSKHVVHGDQYIRGGVVHLRNVRVAEGGRQDVIGDADIQNPSVGPGARQLIGSPTQEELLKILRSW